MTIDRTIEKYYYLTEDEQSKVGNASIMDRSIGFDFFFDKDFSYELSSPLNFQIDRVRFAGITGDFQINNCGFLLFSDRLRSITEKYLTGVDRPKWYSAKVYDLEGKIHDYSILNFFNQADFLDKSKSTFVPGTDHPIKERFDLNKIGERLIFRPSLYGSKLCVHDVVREEMKRSNSTGLYFYKIHTAGRLS